MRPSFTEPSISMMPTTLNSLNCRPRKFRSIALNAAPSLLATTTSKSICVLTMHRMNGALLVLRVAKVLQDKEIALGTKVRVTRNPRRLLVEENSRAVLDGAVVASSIGEMCSQGTTEVTKDAAVSSQRKRKRKRQ